MNDMKITAEPRSDQWNADDFQGGPRTFTIAGVKAGAATQKYDIELVEGEGRVWRPPVTMLRVLLNAWQTDDAKEWVGRKVRLFTDPTVTFGKEVPGGIRISHLSHIDKTVKVPITVKRASRSVYVVEPLVEQPTVPGITAEQWATIHEAATVAGIENTGQFVGETIGRQLTGWQEITPTEYETIMARINTPA